MNKVLPEFRFGFEKMERFDPDAAFGGALQKEMFVKKIRKIHRKTIVGDGFCWYLSFRV